METVRYGSPTIKIVRNGKFIKKVGQKKMTKDQKKLIPKRLNVKKVLKV